MESLRYSKRFKLFQRLEQFVNNTGQTGALDFYNYYKNQNTLDQLNEKLEKT